MTTQNLTNMILGINAWYKDKPDDYIISLGEWQHNLATGEPRFHPTHGYTVGEFKKWYELIMSLPPEIYSTISPDNSDIE